jgi:hypothetical protein
MNRCELGTIAVNSNRRKLRRNAKSFCYAVCLLQEPHGITSQKTPFFKGLLAHDLPHKLCSCNEIALEVLIATVNSMSNTLLGLASTKAVKVYRMKYCAKWINAKRDERERETMTGLHNDRHSSARGAKALGRRINIDLLPDASVMSAGAV